MFRFGFFLSLLGFGPLLLAVGTILVLGWRGRPAWAAPHCRKCRYDLRGKNPEELRHCPECGADLKARRAVVFSRQAGRRWGLIAWGVTILLLPLLMGAGLMLYQRVATRLNPQALLSPNQLTAISTADLLRYQLPGRVDQPWVWRELANRLKTRALSRAETEQAIATLVAHLEQKRAAGEPVSLAWTNEFLEPALASGVLSQEALLQFYDAYFAPPSFQPLPRLREGRQQLSLRITGGNPWSSNQLPHAMVWRVTRASLDGQPLSRSFNTGGSDAAHAYPTVDLAPGEHELSATVECLLYEKADVKDADLQSVPPENWPQGLRRWTVELPATFRVYDKDEPMVRLETVPDLRPAVRQAISIKALIFKMTDRELRSEMRYTIDRSLPISLSFDAAIRLGETLTPIGSVSYIHDGSHDSGQITRGMQQALPHPIPAELRSADIVLTPNPRHVERDARVTEIWGEPITLPSVELVRLDLPGGDAVEPAP